MNVSKYIGGITRICCFNPTEIIISGIDEFILDCASIILKLGHFLEKPSITILSENTDKIKMNLQTDFKYHDWKQKEPLLNIQYIDYTDVEEYKQYIVTISRIRGNVILLSDETSEFKNIVDRNINITQYDKASLSKGTIKIISIAQMLFLEKNGVSIEEWKQLPKLYKEQYIYQAAHHFIKFSISGYFLNQEEELIDKIKQWNSFHNKITNALEVLSELEHNRWWAVMLGNGYRFGDKRDIISKTHPDMKPYRELDDTIKQKDRDMILNSLNVFQKMGYSPSPII